MTPNKNKDERNKNEDERIRLLIRFINNTTLHNGTARLKTKILIFLKTNWIAEMGIEM